MKKLIALLLLIPSIAFGARLHHEKYYQNNWCADRGVTEFILPDRTRVDCLTSVYAVEVDFADKWAESVGQALYYAYMTDRKAGILLVMENPAKDWVYQRRLHDAIRGLDIKVWIVTP